MRDAEGKKSNYKAVPAKALVFLYDPVLVRSKKGPLRNFEICAGLCRMVTGMKALQTVERDQRHTRPSDLDASNSAITTEGLLRISPFQASHDQALGAGVPVSNVCSSLPGLKRTAFPGVMLTSVPVRGLRPIPVLRARTLNTPKPRSSMRSPAARASFRPSNTVSTAASALVRGRPVRSITWCTMSCLIKAVTSLARLFSTVPRPTGLMVQPLAQL
jgi:hypothetical protein